MSKHTPEPWRVCGLGIYAGEPDSKGNYSRDTQVVPFYDMDLCSANGKRHMRDLERIVACVNACAGIVDPLAIPDCITALHDCLTEQGATAEQNHKYAMRRLEAINETVLAALNKLGKAN